MLALLMIGLLISWNGINGLDNRPNPCVPDPCNAQGLCRILIGCPPDATGVCLTNENGHYACDCNVGFTGLVCNFDDPCEPNPCSTGTCFAEIPCDPLNTGPPTYRCLCPEDKVGNNCQLDNPCMDPGLCLHGGTCVPDSDGGHICECTPEYTGLQCESDNPCHTNNPCKHGGTCVPEGTTPVPTCVCPSDYTGAACEISLLKCRPNPCHNHATCIETPDSSFECKCLPGFVGKLCQNRCPCQNGGQCVYGHMGQLTCVCQQGFNGGNCQFGGTYKRSHIKKQKKHGKH